MIKSDGFYDYTWNPVEGCLHGCEYCYARRDLERRGKSFKPTFYPDRLDEPKMIKVKKRIFVTHYCDLFGTWVPRNWVLSILDVIKRSGHDYIFITKNPLRYYEYEFSDNCILGVTVESSYEWHRTKMMEGLKNRKMASIEPLLGSFAGYDFLQFDLVVIGDMIGAKSNIKSEWVNSIKHENIFYKPNIRRHLK